MGYTVQINRLYDFRDITKVTLFFERRTYNMRPTGSTFGMNAEIRVDFFKNSNIVLT